MAEMLKSLEILSDNRRRIVTNQRAITVTCNDGVVFTYEKSYLFANNVIESIFVRTFAYPSYGMRDYSPDQVPSDVMITAVVLRFAGGYCHSINLEGKEYGFSRDSSLEVADKIISCKVPRV